MCISNRPDPARLILTFGASINKKDIANGNTPLHWACTSGNYAVVRLLVDAGADLMSQNNKVLCPYLLSFSFFHLVLNFKIFSELWLELN